ncbi:MAG: hypothetical protein AAB446_00165 [Patescibacteria group bacterium]
MKFKTKTKILIFLPVVFFSFFLFANISLAAITFTDGFWNTSFVGCTSGDAGYGDICDGLQTDDPVYACTSGGANLRSQITTLANYASGAGSQGYRFFQGDTRNEDSSSMSIRFSPVQPEVWVRYYTRYPAGQSWAGILEHKMIYAFANGGVAMNVNFPQGMNSIGINPRGTMNNPDIYINGWGWNNLYGSDVGDGSWHLYEHHFKLGNSGQNNGVYQFWVDGIIRVNRQDMDFFNGGAASPTGWDHIYIPSNHNVSTLAGCNGIDVDDVAIADPNYASFIQDAGGRNMIGGVNLSPPPPDTTAPSAPTGVAVQ